GGHLVSNDEPGKRSFQPMNINFGLFPDLEPGSIVKPEGVHRFRGKDKTIMKKQLMAARALSDCASWLGLDESSAQASGSDASSLSAVAR
ncbi:MAG: FADH(2)-oxidizing methylenetetrahydrofolate--tRNA-(uracil(54)-C(5))-methyltransferase TrmFO, partial [Pseudomonadota bacterium]|nr:FADH(2)-oxidizing methylenetetrahydrofolate--tRNA-(uracil(54)-C(5))-methyltransferase TrmFO [Pseudomonadota bacterium]